MLQSGADAALMALGIIAGDIGVLIGRGSGWLKQGRSPASV
jgi:hypothetical protein